MSKRFCFCLSVLFLFQLLAGCDVINRNRHLAQIGDRYKAGRDLTCVHGQAILEIAQEITWFEDELRRDGTITVKSPDVWTDSNLMHSIQEFDQEMEKTVGKFKETIQAFLSESDSEGTLSDFAIKVNAGELDAADGDSSATDLLGKNNLDVTRAKELYAALKAINGIAKPSSEFKLEPTQLERQHATYVNVNQALRRKKMGGDNIRRPGYGLYLFRIPVSVLPGEETDRGYCAVANFKANMVVTPADIRFTLPRMAIAELVDVVATNVLNHWDSKPEPDAKEAKKVNNQPKLDPHSSRKRGFKSFDFDHSQLASQNKVGPEKTAPAAPKKFTKNDYLAIREYCKNQLEMTTKPNIHELRTKLFDGFLQLTIHLQEIQVPIDGGGIYEPLDRESLAIAAKNLEVGADTTRQRSVWIEELKKIASFTGENKDYQVVAWLVARHCALTDLNIKRLIRSIALKREFTEEFVQEANCINFFSSTTLEEATAKWKALLEKEFPLQVFNLEPVTEEQNLLDSQSRLRQMQVALAYSVAHSKFNVAQRVQLAKELARDTAAIGVNRTTIGFVHGMDSFGWYFYPRVQSPDRIDNGVVWNSLFPQTRDQDAKTYKLEPGIRECEVLIAMPNFVTQVSFDVTTNWERLSRPGKAKRSYQELIAEGCKLQDLRNSLSSKECVVECREGDLARLSSRIDQIESMLGMQTHFVDVPFEYDQPVGDLFDQGERSLRPVVYGYHGLSQVAATEKVGDETKAVIAEFFVTGKNFHPTLTHVVMGGHEYDTIGNGDQEVQILSRQLIKVKATLRTDILADSKGFEIRVGTPSGMSNPLFVIRKGEKKKAKTPSVFDWSAVPKFEYYTSSSASQEPIAILKSTSNPADYSIKIAESNPMTIAQLATANAKIQFVYTVTFDDKTTKSCKCELRELQKIECGVGLTHAEIAHHISCDLAKLVCLPEHKRANIKVESYLIINEWPRIKMDKTIEIKLIPHTNPK